MNKVALLKKYNNVGSSNYVLGALLNNPKLLDNKNFPLSNEDFVVKTHKHLFTTINNLVSNGLTTITMVDIENYLSNNNEIVFNLFFGNNTNNFDWLSMLFEEGEDSNYSYYYNDLKKYSLLRTYIDNGIDVTDILDLTEVDTVILDKQQEAFNKMRVEYIITHYDNKYRTIRNSFNRLEERENRKSGDNARGILKKLQEGSRYGLNTEMPVETELTGGLIPKRFLLFTLPSGVGKTRNAIKKLVTACSPLLWDFKTNKFIKNPNGDYNAGVYIGNELDIANDLEPMILAFISGVNENKIKSGELNEEERDRLNIAIKCSEQMELHLENNDDYDIQYFKNIFEEYSTKYQNSKYTLRLVVIDYIELTPALMSEYSSYSKGVPPREDLILLNLSKEIKNLANDYDITVVGYTQTTGEAFTMGYRDFRAVKGGRAIPNKADVGITCFPPTAKELDLLKDTQKRINLIHKPNIVFTLYKNRFGTIKDYKLWVRQDLGIGKYEFLFATDAFYQPVNVKEWTVNLRDEDNEMDSRSVDEIIDEILEEADKIREKEDINENNKELSE